MEANRKRVQVHSLPTENGVIFKNRTTGTLVMKISNVAKKLYPAQHLYFTTDEEIKEGDWAYNPDNNRVFQPKDLAVNLVELRKIIATTDPKLTKKKCTNCSGKGHIDRDGFRYCHCKTGEVYNIAQPSQALIKAYCEQGGFDEVDVEYDFKTLISEDVYNEIVTFLKVDPIHNTITTHRIVEKMYSLEEIKSKMRLAYHKGIEQYAYSNDFDEDKWIKEKLKQ